MIRCRSCNEELPDEATFCTECGEPTHKLRSSTAKPRPQGKTGPSPGSGSVSQSLGSRPQRAASPESTSPDDEPDSGGSIAWKRMLLAAFSAGWVLPLTWSQFWPAEMDKNQMHMFFNLH
jgi:ribosomal protein L40E